MASVNDHKASDPLLEWFSYDSEGKRTRTDKKIAKDLVTMGHSVKYINDIIAGNAATDVNDDRKKAIVGDNVMSLENNIAYKDWKGDEDFTDANAAIVAGKKYVSE